MGVGSGGSDNQPFIMTGFDIERILRREGAPKGFARAVAAACRAAGLFDRRQADEEKEIQVMIDAVEKIIEFIRR